MLANAYAKHLNLKRDTYYAYAFNIPTSDS